MLLNDEEIQHIESNLPCGYRPHESWQAAVEYGDAVKKAQLKAVVEWMNTKYHSEEYIAMRPMINFRVTLEEWQSVQKEVE